MPDKPATMRDVADKAGVSIQTVSAVVNGKDGISQRTRNRVLDVVKQLNYKRDPIARSMRTGQTGLIGLLVQDITNPILSNIASRVEALVSAEDHNVVLYNASSDAARERVYLELVENRLIDGVIVVNAVDQAHTLDLLAKAAIPAIFIDSLMTPTVPAVTADDVGGAYLATDYLIGLGHERIAHISGANPLEITQRRIQGYTSALADQGIDYHQVIAPQSTRWDYRAGYEAMQDLLQRDSRPTAVFAASDEMAIGVYRACHEHGLSVPQDLSVVGFDDIQAAAFASPPLTTVRQPFEAMASHAVKLLFQTLQDPQRDPVEIKLRPELVVRESAAELA